LKALRARRRVVAVGLGFAKQQVDDVPHGVEDAALDWMLTERWVLKFDRPGADKGSELDK
jgi:5-formyltetrahydrofolate cyclo-ligase